MANSPQGFSKADVDNKYPRNWSVTDIAGAIDQIPTGRKFDAKAVVSDGRVPILDQKANGFFGFHDGEPGVVASPSEPVVTFSNHRCMVRLMTRPFSTIQNVFAMRGKDGFVETRFLYYLIRDRVQPVDYKGYFPTLRDIWIGIPPLDEQRRIVDVLGSLDHLIEINQTLIQDLDSTFHLEWARRFGSQHFREPQPLSQIVETQYGFTDSATDETAGPKFLRVADINKRNWIDWPSVPHCSPEARASEKYLLRKGDLVVARMADPGKSALIDEDVDAVFASYLVRLSPKDRSLSFYIYGFLKSRAYFDYAAGAMSGTVQKNMNARVITGVDIAIPREEALEDFNAFASQIRESMSKLRQEVSELEGCRAALLPLLMSGRVRVEDVAP